MFRCAREARMSSALLGVFAPAEAIIPRTAPPAETCPASTCADFAAASWRLRRWLPNSSTSLGRGHRIRNSQE